MSKQSGVSHSQEINIDQGKTKKAKRTKWWAGPPKSNSQ